MQKVRTRPSRWGVVWQIAALVATLGFGQASEQAPAQTSERGFRFMTVYGPEDYDGPTHNNSVVETADGLVFVGNLTGLLEFDGEVWRHHNLASGSAVTSLSADPSGLVAVGGHDDLGYLSPDPMGTLQYVSLAPRVTEVVETVGAVLAIRRNEHGFLFVTTDHIVWWSPKDRAIHVDFAESAIPNPGDFDARVSFQAGDEVFFHSADQGLRRWETFVPGHCLINSKLP